MEFHAWAHPEDVRESIVHRLSGLGFSHFTLFHGPGNGGYAKFLAIKNHIPSFQKHKK